MQLENPRDTLSLKLPLPSVKSVLLKPILALLRPPVSEAALDLTIERTHPLLALISRLSIYSKGHSAQKKSPMSSEPRQNTGPR